MSVQPVHLTPLELAIAEFVFQQRDRDGLLASADPHKHGFFESKEKMDAYHRNGVKGEMAFAKGRNLYWTGMGVGYYEDDDVGRTQIRTTEHDHGHLIIRPSEQHVESPWVLVTGHGADFTLRGWCFGFEGRQQRFLKAPNGRPPAFFVPQVDGPLREIFPR